MRNQNRNVNLFFYLDAIRHSDKFHYLLRCDKLVHLPHIQVLNVELLYLRFTPLIYFLQPRLDIQNECHFLLRHQTDPLLGGSPRNLFLEDGGAALQPASNFLTRQDMWSTFTSYWSGPH
jgi:hypothetical protein